MVIEEMPCIPCPENCLCVIEFHCSWYVCLDNYFHQRQKSKGTGSVLLATHTPIQVNTHMVNVFVGNLWLY